jgi:2-polyprenyl-3-methyl-5-hydroxy-6-metoxy-1,4-benzoquinol methylase
MANPFRKRMKSVRPVAVVFAMNHPDTAAQAHSVVRNLEKIGYRCVVCDYAIGEGLDPRRLATNADRAVLPLSDRGFDSIIPLSAAVYQGQYGDDIAFADLLALNLTNIPKGQGLGYDLLHPESLFRQKLRGFAARSEELLRALKPDLIVIQQGAEVLSRILLSKAMKLRLPWLLSESPFFPNYLLLDPCGQHFMRGHNQIDLDWPEWNRRLLDDVGKKRVATFIDQWRSQRLSKYAQPEQSDPKLTAFLGGNERLLFVPMQISHDANVHYGLGVFLSLADFYQSLVEALPPNWGVVFKPHPLDRTSNPWRPEAAPHIFLTEHANIHDLIQRADAVAVFSSNVGLEALLYGKPVIVGGKPCYGGKGVTLDIGQRQDLATIIANAPRHTPNSESRDRLVHYIINDYLIADEDNTAIQRKLARTGVVQSGYTRSERPFSEADPSILAQKIEQLRHYQKLSETDLSHWEILEQLELPGDPFKIEEPGIDKDWPIPWVAHQAPALAAAYVFSASLADKGCRVLDFGCGTGAGAWLLARQGMHVTACDASPARLRYARRTWLHRRIRYLTVSPATFPENAKVGENFGLVLLIDGLAHVRHSKQLLNLLWQSVAPGGACLLRLPRVETAVRPNTTCPFQILTVADVKRMAAQLPDLAGQKVLYQHRTSIQILPGAEYDSFWLLLEKECSNDKGSGWSKRLHELLPGSFTPPSEFSTMGFLRVLARRRHKLFGLR